MYAIVVFYARDKIRLRHATQMHDIIAVKNMRSIFLPLS